MVAQSLAINNGLVAITGPLTFDTVAQLSKQSQKLIRSNKALTFDFKAVTKCDSAGLALLINWLARAKAHNCQLHFQHIPSQLKAIASVTGVEQLLV